MADRDGTTIDVEFVGIGRETVPAVPGLRGEGLVEFPQGDIVDCESVLLEQPGNGEDWTDIHLVGVAPIDGDPSVDAQRRQAAPCRFAGFHENGS